MKNLFFYLEEETREWCHQQFKLIEVKETHQWKLMTGTKSTIFFDSIYDALGNLYQKGYVATFKIPKSMENMPSSCNS